MSIRFAVNKETGLKDWKQEAQIFHIAVCRHKSHVLIASGKNAANPV